MNLSFSLKIEPVFLFIDIILASLVFIQVYLGDKLVWIYGLHTVPVVNAIREGII